MTSGTTPDTKSITNLTDSATHADTRTAAGKASTPSAHSSSTDESATTSHDVGADSSSAAARTSGKAGVRAPMKSKKLDRTLHELESAFTEWESLSGKPKSVVHDVVNAEVQRKSEAKDQTEAEFRQKTKKLLCRLREQLAELED